MIIKGVQLSEKTDFSGFLDKHKKTQIFDASLFVSKKHVEHCVEQALKAFAQKRNISKSPELEFLLCLTCQRQVSKALNSVKVKKKAVFVSWGNSWKNFEKEFDFKEFVLKDIPDMNSIQQSATFWVKP